MPTNSNFNQQSSTSPVPGGYAQPSPGVTEQIVTIGDPQGNAYATSMAASGVANLQTAAFRDSTVTVQATATQTSPTASTVIATITPGTAGLWEVSGEVTVSGTTVAAADTNNMTLFQTATSRLPILTIVPSTTGSTVAWPITPITLNLSGADTVNVKAVANATTNAVYGATLVARRVG